MRMVKFETGLLGIKNDKIRVLALINIFSPYDQNLISSGRLEKTFALWLIWFRMILEDFDSIYLYRAVLLI